MSTWPPRADDVFQCLYRMLVEGTNCQHIPVSINTYKENYLFFGSQGLTDGISYLGLCVLAGLTVWSNPVELEDVKEIAFTVQRAAGHCGLSVIASLETVSFN